MGSLPRVKRGPYIGCWTPARFWAKVAIRGPDKCWIWLGGCRGPYGVSWDGRVQRQRSAHVIAYELAWEETIDPPNEGLHHCDIPLCCNPAHIFSGTQKDNYHDMVMKGRLGNIGARKGVRYPNSRYL